MEQDKNYKCSSEAKRKCIREEEENKMMPSIFAECHPISNLEEMYGVLQEPPRWVERVVPLAPRTATVVQNTLADCHSDSDYFLPKTRVDARIVPKTLVCHDYKGGYQADKYLHYVNEDILGNGYTFYNWAQIDVFVYFSHHLMTIPPLCWINVGHSNGVKVLGTLITESDSGAELCDKKLFKDAETMRSFAKSLAELVKVFRFDGWLLNIENDVENVEVLKEFVAYLTGLIHSDNPENLVIWYDSVTEGGKLDWQNMLNSKNRCFFDACDGIFLNYGWSDQHLIKSAEAAQHRSVDVFVGIDVFGRQMVGGGQLFTFKAMEIATRNNLSLAIFAPGWTHETIEKSDMFFEEFLNKDAAFWSSLWPYFYTHPVNRYFSTNFYIGLDKTCYNMFSQQQQLSKVLNPRDVSLIPHHQNVITLNNKCSCLQSVTVGSKNSCLLTRKNLKRNVEYVHHLFACDLAVSENTLMYHLTKSTDKCSAKLIVTILTCGRNGHLRKIKFLSARKGATLDNVSFLEVNPSEESDVYESVKGKCLKMVEEEKWELSVYMFNTEPCNILEVGATIDAGDSILLGAFGIENADGDFLKKK